MTKAIVTQEIVKDILYYEPSTGIFTWKARKQSMFKNRAKNACEAWNLRYAEKEAGHIGTNGYRIISVFGTPFGAHRLAWLYVYGRYPAKEIDHINHDRSDNRIENLRAVTSQENGRNAKLSAANNSGTAGVGWHKATGKWRARIQCSAGEMVYLGLFYSKSEAIKVRKDAEVRLDYHENHGT